MKSMCPAITFPLPPNVCISSGLSMRDQHILAYAEYLHSDPALWRITVDYMYSCGIVGKERADEILIRVPLRLHEQSAESAEKGTEKKIRAGDVVGVLKDVNQTCFEHQREAVRRTVCRVGSFQTRCSTVTLVNCNFFR